MANSSGLPRRIDHLGRIVVPVELRRQLGINPGDELEIAVRDDSITLTKNHLTCVFCGSQEGLESYRDRMICQECAQEAAERFSDLRRTG
jgi:transcriptional pleiotropic regulator of transition state genes